MTASTRDPGLTVNDSKGLESLAGWPCVPALRADAERTRGRRWLTVDALDRAQTDGLDVAEESGVAVLVAAERARRATPDLEYLRAEEAAPLRYAALMARMTEEAAARARLGEVEPCTSCGRPVAARRGVLQPLHGGCRR